MAKIKEAAKKIGKSMAGGSFKEGAILVSAAIGQRTLGIAINKGLSSGLGLSIMSKIPARLQPSVPLFIQFLLAGVAEAYGKGAWSKGGKALQTANIVTLGAMVAEGVFHAAGISGVDFTPMGGVQYTPMAGLPDLRGMGHSSADFGHSNADFGRASADFGGVDFTPMSGAHDGDAERSEEEGEESGSTG